MGCVRGVSVGAQEEVENQTAIVVNTAFDSGRTFVFYSSDVRALLCRRRRRRRCISLLYVAADAPRHVESALEMPVWPSTRDACLAFH